MDIADMLSGGDPRSLGNTDYVVSFVLAEPAQLADLFACVFDADAIVRMRAADGLEKICRQHPAWFEPFKERLFGEWSRSVQPSLQWHLAQILSEISLEPAEAERAIAILLRNLAATDDWIVTNLTLESLATFVRNGAFDRQPFITILKQYQHDRHKSVVSKARTLLKECEDG
jgi:hypothetical protein